VSLLGSWDFEVKHGDAVYRCFVDDARVRIEAESGLVMRAKWTLDGLDDWDGDEGSIPDEEIPADVQVAVELEMRAMAESEDA
jgi:hypothetical protein